MIRCYPDLPASGFGSRIRQRLRLSAEETLLASVSIEQAHKAFGSTRVIHGVDVSIQEVAFSRNVSGVLVWQFDRRKLARVGGALNYGRATVRCIWPLRPDIWS